MEALSEDSDSTNLPDWCFYKCGRNARWRFSCHTCSVSCDRPMVVRVCTSCREKTVCFLCGSARDGSFRSDSDKMSNLEYLSSSASSTGDTRDMTQTVGNIEDFGNLADQVRMCEQIAQRHAKGELHTQLTRFLGRSITSDDIKYEATEKDGCFYAYASTDLLQEVSGTRPVRCGKHGRNRTEAERLAALSMISQLSKGAFVPAR
mmetsp:Transcript_90604/g.143128  ORF Transcript_90604/g.143128 Transcript_90604/m.143128 type:complete len:205 (-) Transcript_90604:681-1295(-)